MCIYVGGDRRWVEVGVVRECPLTIIVKYIYTSEETGGERRSESRKGVPLHQAPTIPAPSAPKQSARGSFGPPDPPPLHPSPLRSPIEWEGCVSAPRPHQNTIQPPSAPQVSPGGCI